MKPFTWTFLTSLSLAFGVSNAVLADDRPTEAATKKAEPTWANLAAGPVAVVNGSATAGIPKRVAVTRIDREPGAGSVVRIKIPGTNYAIPLVDGRVTPVIVKEYPREVWRIDGMRFTVGDHDPSQRAASESIGNANRIEPSDGRLRLILDGGEVHETWTLDFTNRSKGLRIRYDDGGGW